MKYDITAKDPSSQARAGRLNTDHGIVETPVFMPVGTVGSVKGVHQRELQEDIGAPIILGNTYHLYLRPGTQILYEAGGLHRFINWPGAVLTDSGGYQVFSLAHRRKLSEEGVRFQSHIDGSYHRFTPENVVDTQRIFGADIMMPLDECTPYPADYAYARKSMELTHKWLEQGYLHYRNTQPLYGHSQAYFPIVQGSIYKDLRRASAEFAAAYANEGIAIGGLSVGEPTETMYEMVAHITPLLPQNMPRYLMGVGTPANILESIALGVDMFDCVMPTRNGRNGMLFTSEGIINIKNKKWERDYTPIDPNGTVFTDQTYSRAYLRHLVQAKEMLGAQIASVHNLGFYLWLVKEARKQIEAGTFTNFKNRMLPTIMQRL